MARFFIDRPVFAWVIALFIMLGGAFAIRALPVAQYPDIAPPVVSIYATYPGASAQVVEESVTALIEREMNGAPGLLYTSATSSAGMASLYLTFRQGVNGDLAAVEVQNRLKTVEARLPEPVRRDGIQVEKAADNIQLVVSLTSDDGRMTGVQLGEYASANVVQALRRVDGVGRVQFWGAEYAMRIWPDPVKLAGHGLTASDIAAAVRAHNARVTVGDIGRSAVPDSAPIAATVFADAPLKTPADFGAIALRSQADGAALYLRDVARIEFGGSDYNYPSYVNGKVAVGMGIKLAPGSNAVATEKRIRAAMDELSAYFPPGVKYQIPYETSSFVRVSMNKVVTTLIEAGVLVFLVMFLFMQNLRATLIPTLVVPVALAGTFGVMYAAGFSINVLTMFGMVLAIGILVDDAIVVVENVERLMVEERLAPYDATVKAMKQISGAIVGITVVLTSVFVPMAFFGGAVGNIYRQFALSLAVSIAFSAFLALSLTPALCATLLKPIDDGHHDKRGFFGWFNRFVARSTQRYATRVGAMLNKPLRWLVVYGALTAVAALMLTRLPSAFLPDEDQGNFMVMVIRPQGTPLAETMQSVREVESYLRREEPAAYTFALGGFNLYGEGPNGGMIFVTLKNWNARQAARDHVQAIVARVNERFAGTPNTTVFAMNSPALPDLGSTGGFDFRMQNRGGLDYAAFSAAREQLLAAGARDAALTDLMFAGTQDAPQLKLDIDRAKASALGVSMDEINTTLAVMFGSDYIGDFMHGTQVRRVIVQADGQHRLDPDDVKKLRVRNARGEMVPLAAFATLHWTLGPPQLTRYNGYPSFTINGSAAPGHSSGEAMAAIERIAATLPAGIGHAWSGQSFEERLSGAQAPLLFALSVLVVFLALAALYESWSIPLAVMLVVPLGVIGAVLGVTLRAMPNDIYFKVGLIATIGLSAKNAILIVEVAKDLLAQRMSLAEAALEAARLRLRPIVMTSLAFGVGVLPLAFASGAASGAQTAIGTGVLGGVIAATVLAVFLVPLFFVVVGRLFGFGTRRRGNAPAVNVEGSR
ncbi:multidrug efflux RND transporter permease subunit [Burkholderia multivorans]|uniref:multidrug efflux RND transporter permease subunit n=1 Tax=Burkholderia multivorans TaxID=87883 RepID=UPI0012DE16C2|nr:multidrug efflux RND transporter permease subunit [Burkholderia multivorans]MBU9339565.1 multidrug efflux RND transporter permease subunit [Burkholderia multivorans]MCA8139852.1 multidrug efflux RND transporter permease subunit [Burkholderia multivorans]MCO1366690.1 multidrug efflux RND transporter permease subunit [Burkholderia multivorans]MCO1376299.1 multidrug efflux RND transporter permease subunit [Burkholderia multivorans]QGR60877.1 multidrug efflux RND transporter permease subunit [B